MDVNWNEVPPQFHFFRPAIEACGETRIVPFDKQLQRHVMFWERASAEQLAELAKLHTTLSQNKLAVELYDWCDSVGLGDADHQQAASRLLAIMGLLAQLADADISPFCNVTFDRPFQEGADQQEDTLPENLRYLIGPALHFGERYNCELQMIRFFDEASPEECEQLAQLAERIRRNQEWPRVCQWLRESDWKTARYHSEIDQLFNLMVLCDFDFE